MITISGDASDSLEKAAPRDYSPRTSLTHAHLDGSDDSHALIITAMSFSFCFNCQMTTRSPPVPDTEWLFWFYTHYSLGLFTFFSLYKLCIVNKVYFFLYCHSLFLIYINFRSIELYIQFIFWWIYDLFWWLFKILWQIKLWKYHCSYSTTVFINKGLKYKNEVFP